MPRTLVGAIEQVVSKPSTFGRNLQRLATPLHATNACCGGPAVRKPTQSRRFADDFSARTP
jgi:hypothetical protein